NRTIVANGSPVKITFWLVDPVRAVFCTGLYQDFRFTRYGAALRGQPVKVVRRQLRRLGLEVRVRWQPSSRLSPGKVMSVRPTGRVGTGTTIVVAGALQPTGTGPSQSTPVSSSQPQPTGKARQGKVHRSGRPDSPSPTYVWASPRSVDISP